MSQLAIKKAGRWIRKTADMYTTGKSLRAGDMFTIDGCGTGSKGQTVVNGRNIATNRKCKAVKLTVYVVKSAS